MGHPATYKRRGIGRNPAPISLELMTIATARWEKSFEIYEAGLTLLRRALERGPGALNQLETEGLIHRFEYSLELAWKIARDFLEESGMRVAPRTPREVLRQAAAAQVVEDSQVWIDLFPSLQSARNCACSRSRWANSFSSAPVVVWF